MLLCPSWNIQGQEKTFTCWIMGCFYLRPDWIPHGTRALMFHPTAPPPRETSVIQPGLQREQQHPYQWLFPWMNPKIRVLWMETKPCFLHKTIWLLQIMAEIQMIWLPYFPSFPKATISDHKWTVQCTCSSISKLIYCYNC